MPASETRAMWSLSTPPVIFASWAKRTRRSGSSTMPGSITFRALRLCVTVSSTS